MSNAPHHRAAARRNEQPRESRFGGSVCMWWLGAVFNGVAAPLSLRAGAVFGSRRGAAPLNLRLTRRLFVIVRLPGFARLLIQHLTPAFSGATNGTPRPMRRLLAGLRSNA